MENGYVYFMPYALVFVTWLVLGYNLFQLSAAYTWVDEQILRYRSSVNEERMSARTLRILNAASIILLAIGYLVLLYQAGLAYWVLTWVGLKFFLSGILSDYLQTRVLLNRPYSLRSHIVTKADAFANALTLTFILLVCVFP